MLLGKSAVLNFLSRAISLGTDAGLEAEAYYHGERVSVMRSARRGVHQTTTARDGELVLRLRKKRRTAEVMVSCPEALEKAVLEGKKLIASAEPNELLYELAGQPKYLPEETLNTQSILGKFWDDLPCKEMAFRTIRKAQQATPGWYGAGCFLCAANEVGAANSAGLLRYAAGYYSAFTIVATGGRRKRQLTTYADAFSRLPQQLDFRAAIEEAFSKARLTDSLPFLDPLHGKHRFHMDAILSPNCVAEWMRDVNSTFSGYRIHTKESYVAGRTRGKSRIAGSNITLWENWRDPRGIQTPFDLEGRTRQKVTLINHGVYSGCVYDGMSAVLAKAKPTGHSSFDLGTDDPEALVMAGQANSLDDLVRSCDRPTLIITWPHYTSEMYEKEGMWTFTGHHGVFLAQGGRVVAVCPPTRLRLRTFDALRRVVMMTPAQPVYDAVKYPMEQPIGSVVPWVKIRGVEFINL